MLDHKKILVFDFETSGLSAKTDQVIELGALLLELTPFGYKTIKEENYLVKFNGKLPSKIVEITNITDEMLDKDGISEEQMFKVLDSLIDQDTLLIAYNISFDIQFVIELFRKYKNPNYQMTNDILDAMAIYKDRHPYPHKLDNGVATYKVSVPNTHRALDDVKATYELLKKLDEESPVLRKYVNIIGYNPKYPPYPNLRIKTCQYVPQYGAKREIEKLNQ